jgi:SAM-dependent methyltransferase
MASVEPTAQVRGAAGFADRPGEGGLRNAEPASFAAIDDELALQHFKAASHFEALLRAAIEATGVEIEEGPDVLVLGCGSGANAVAPCLRLFRGARILATDWSSHELGLLSRHLRFSRSEDRVNFQRMEPESLAVAPGSFDLVAGVSVLHRRVDPDKVLAGAARALRPGGHAIFMEPFEGYGILRLAFERILAEAKLRRVTLPPRLRSALAASVGDIAARTQPDTARPDFSRLEQKWLFSREAIEAASLEFGFSAVRFVSHHDHPTLYRDMAALILRQATGSEALELPAWAWAVFDEFDRALPPSVKRLLMLEATIVLTR